MTFHNPRAFAGLRTGTPIQARGNDPLTDDQLRRFAPSIFATDAHESRSARFAPVPTAMVLDGLRREGFEPFYAIQSRTRDEGRRDYTKHMLRLRHRGMKNDRGEAFEIVLVNANDGSAAYHMIPGFFRFVCLNGLMTGESFDPVKVRHSGDAVGEVIEGAYRVLGEAPALSDQVQVWKGLALSPPEREAFAEAAHVLRFPDAAEDDQAAPIAADRLLQLRRADDRGADLWRTLNTVQENVIRGGQGYVARNANGARRRGTVREVTGIDQNRALNRALWTLAERMAALKAA
jgi:hypothetical protein